MKASKRLSIFAPMISVALVGTCIGISLMGYEAPIYKVQAFEGNVIENHDEPEKQVKIKDRKNEPENQAQEEENSEPLINLDSVNGSFDLEDGIYEGSGTGFSGIVRVAVEIKDRKIANIEIISNEDDEAFFNRAQTVINRIINSQSTEVDIVSGATYSSRGIIDAVADALHIGGASNNRTNVNSTDGDLPGENNSFGNNNGNITASIENNVAVNELINDMANDAKLKDGTYYGTGTGFAGDLTVQVIIVDGKITSVSIVSTVDGEPFIEMASTVLNGIVEKQSIRVDTVSGATYSSRGMIEAAAKAISQAVINSSEGVDGLEDYMNQSNNESSDYHVSENNHDGNDGKEEHSNRNEAGDNVSRDASKDVTHPEDSNIPVTPINSGTIPYIDGVYYGSGEGFSGEVKVSVEIKDHTIVAVNVVSTGDDAVFFNRAVTLIEDVIKKQTTDIDTVSGATFSSEGILSAIEEALASAKEATDKEITDDEITDNDVTDKEDSNHHKKEDSTSDDNIKDSDENCENHSETEDKDETNSDINKDDGSDSSDSHPQNENDAQEEGDNSSGQYRNGTYQVSVPCSPDDDEMFDEYHLTMKITILKDKIVEITEISGDGDTSNDSFIRRAATGTSKMTGMVKRITDAGISMEIDTVSGATCTSKAIIEACRKAFELAKAPAQEIFAGYYGRRRNSLERFNDKDI